MGTYMSIMYTLCGNVIKVLAEARDKQAAVLVLGVPLPPCTCIAEPRFSPTTPLLQPCLMLLIKLVV